MMAVGTSQGMGGIGSRTALWRSKWGVIGQRTALRSWKWGGIGQRTALRRWKWGDIGQAPGTANMVYRPVKFKN